MTEVVEKYIKRLYQLAPEDCKGFSEAQLLKAEKRLHITLPEEFRAYYLQLGATKSVNQSHNSLATPQQLYFAGDYLCFCEENQGVVMWAIRKEDLTNPNPRNSKSLRLLALPRHLQWCDGRLALQRQYNGRLGYGKL